MPLDPQAKMFLDQITRFPAMETTTPAHARQMFKMMATSQGLPIPLPHVEDRSIPGPAGEIPVRIYRPDGDGPFPALIFFHGGGFVIGDLDSYDALCREFVSLGNFAVVSVDYRLAPEHKFPAAVEDAYAAAKWAYEQAADLSLDPQRLAVGGDSAGGNLAAVVTNLAKERGTLKLMYQVLLYPATDMSQTTESQRECGEGFFLTKSLMEWFGNHYLNDPQEISNPMASPLLFKDFAGLPPALIITAEYDPLRDEGELYAKQLEAAGVTVTLTRYEGMIHGFFSLAAIMDQGKNGIREVAQALQLAFEK